MTDRGHQEVGTASLDTELGRLVVEQRLATKDEVDECLRAQKSLGTDNGHRSLAHLLVEKGYVTARQLNRIKERIAKSRKQQIPGYQLLEEIGRGAMATVYKARQISLDRTVAIKVLPPELSENAEYVERFYREGQAAAKLNHANIVQAIDVGEANGFHYFVMEYVQGHTLYDELARGKIFEEAEALRIIMQIGQALEHAHRQGLIHRDVKPKNIIITRDGVPKLADMGLARVAADVRVAEAEAGRAFGTPYYISPEQIRGEVDIDFRADIYSLGATLYHLVTGRVPFFAPTPVAVMQKHLKEPLVPPDHINTKLSAGLGEVVEVMMAKNPEDRYASTGDMLTDLESIAGGNPPLLARQQIDSQALTHLADEAPSTESAASEESAGGYAGPPSYQLIMLGVGLACSILLNLVLLILYLSK